MNSHQNPLHQLDRTASSKAIAAATHDYGDAWCLAFEDRPPWADDDLDHDPLPDLPDPQDPDRSAAAIIGAPSQSDLMRRLGRAISTPLAFMDTSPTTVTYVASTEPVVIEVDFDTWPPKAKPTSKRRQSPRASTRLNADDAERLLTAYGRGRLMGFEWSAFLTVAWTTIGITTDDQVSAATASLIIRLREWAIRSKDVTGAVGIPVAWIWVHERGPLCGKLHSHFLLSVPRKKRGLLGKVVFDHLERYSGLRPTQGSDQTEQATPDDTEWPSGSPTVGAADFSTVAGAFSSTLHITAPRHDRLAKTFASKRMRYMAKSIDPHTAIQLTTGAKVSLADWIGIDHLADQGEFCGKRCGYSVFSLGGRRWTSWAARNRVSPDLFAYRFRTYGPLDDKSLDYLAQTLRLKT